MNLTEWCLEISKELGVQRDLQLVEDVMYTAIRVGIDELMSNPEYADIDIQNIGRFYLNREYRYQKLPTKPDASDYEVYWTFRFRSHRKARDVFNGRVELSDLCVGNRYIYPEYHLNEEGLVVNPVGNTREYKREQRHPNKYWIEQIDKMQRGEIVLTKDKKFEKRGRPNAKLNNDQIRKKVMTEMKRDWNRENRQLRNGEITERYLGW